MFNKEKATLKKKEKKRIHLLWKEILVWFCSPITTSSLAKHGQEEAVQYPFPPRQWGKKSNLFALFWAVFVFLSDWFLFCLIRSYGGNGGMVSISGWSPLKAKSGTNGI